MEQAEDTTLGGRIRMVRRAAGQSQAAFGAAVGVESQAVSHWERGKNSPSSAKLAEISRRYHVDHQWLTTGEGDMHRLTPAGAEHRQTAGEVGIAVGGPAEEDVRVPVYDVRAAAGHGLVNADRPTPIAHDRFRLAWLRSITSAPPNKLAIIQVAGDSMYPTLAHGDHVLIDMTRNAIDQEGIYALMWNDGLAVKRVTFVFRTRTLTISSDNPAHPTEEGVDPTDVTVVGRVVWLGRRI